jgi:hypothetical protein
VLVAPKYAKSALRKAIGLTNAKMKKHTFIGHRELLKLSSLSWLLNINLMLVVSKKRRKREVEVVPSMMETGRGQRSEKLILVAQAALMRKVRTLSKKTFMHSS